MLKDPASGGRLRWSLLALLLLWPTLVLTEFRPWTLLAPDSLRPTLRFLADFLTPRTDPEFLLLVVQAAWRTVAMATAGMSLALLLAIPMALLSARTLSLSALGGRMARLPGLLRQLVRWKLIVLRSVPELIWALVFVRVVGLGPTAGVLAIALTYAGMLGKVYGDILESGDAQPTVALLRNGAGRLSAFLYALLPQSATELTGYTVYRWECAVRSSAVLGFVGAGGLGQMMDASLKMFAGAEVATLLLVFIGLVALADGLGVLLRKWQA